MEKHNASVEQREKSRQRLIDYNKSKGVTIEILDATTNKISSYSSIREASEALGCVHGTILLAERRQKEGITKLIKKRYLIKNIQRREFHSFALMGDGYFADGCLKICTDNFTKDEVLRLIAVLREKFEIKATINQRINSDGAVK
ncbi:NUMOD1 domain-containing DNA-binding protein (plasmid) [Peribacillus frigoritolerans]|nr:NUMOD1 domain-containing DNA-binding protein [Peribacillus frigoritolerans]